MRQTIFRHRLRQFRHAPTVGVVAVSSFEVAPAQFEGVGFVVKGSFQHGRAIREGARHTLSLVERRTLLFLLGHDLSAFVVLFLDHIDVVPVLPPGQRLVPVVVLMVFLRSNGHPIV